MASRSINIYSPLVRPLRTATDRYQSIGHLHHVGERLFGPQHHLLLSCAAQESSIAAITEEKKAEPAKEAAETQKSSTLTATEKKEAEAPTAAPAAKAAPAKPKKAPAKPLPQMMEEDVIPSLKAILEAQQDISDIEISFQDNRLEGSFIKEGIPYYFWAFFPDGNLTGPRGFSLSSHGHGASTVEPFLIDEKKITDKHLVFWVQKRLAAQGILPVWTAE